jgi:hypothetical protein
MIKEFLSVFSLKVFLFSEFSSVLVSGFVSERSLSKFSIKASFG